MNTIAKLSLKALHLGKPSTFTVSGSKYYIWRNWAVVVDGLEFSVERKKIIEKQYNRIRDYLCFVPHDPITMPDGEIAYCNSGRNFHFVDTEELPKTTAQEIFDICKKSLIQDFENKAGRCYQCSANTCPSI